MSYAVLRTAPGTEFDTESKLISAGVTAWCPKLQWSRRGRVAGVRPMFPGYVFVRSGEDIPAKTQVRARFLMMGDCTLIVTDVEFDTMRKLEEELKEQRKVSVKPIIAGDEVEVMGGALRGRTGRVVRMDRSTAIVKFRGWPLDLVVSIGNLQPTHAVIE